MKRTPLLRRTPLRARSRKMQARYVERRKLVTQMLEQTPWCQRCWLAKATDLHELKNRSQGGDILDPDGIVCLCRPCHRYVTENPLKAAAEGFHKWSWEA